MIKIWSIKSNQKWKKLLLLLIEILHLKDKKIFLIMVPSEQRNMSIDLWPGPELQEHILLVTKAQQVP